MMILKFFLLSVFRHAASATIGPAADMHVVNAIISPDGFNRSAVTVQGTSVGPLVTGNKGDTFKMNVVNSLTDNTMLRSTTIHWHGLFQKGTNWADGPAFINQCPIAANNSFLYDFTDPFLNQYDVDDETTVITLADWYHVPSLENSKFPTADSTLINGLGRWTGSTVSTPLSVITVTKGKRYRIRLASISCDPNFIFQIDGHTNLTVIEVDGVSHQPNPFDSIQIYVGQRYSFILNADQAIGNYWIRANPNVGTQGFAGGINSAILRYAGAPAVEPNTTQATITNPLVESSLVPLVSPAAPGVATVGAADVNLNLDVVFDTSNLDFTVNNVTFIPPTVPVLLQILSGTTAATDLLPSGSVYTLPLNKTIELSIPAGAVGGPHPVHLHGHTFSVVRSAGQTTYNYANPPRRDVVALGATGDNVTIRFQTNNPGPWFLHCHIDWHLNAGFAVVFAEDTADIKLDNPVPADWSQLCPIYDSLDSSQL